MFQFQLNYCATIGIECDRIESASVAPNGIGLPLSLISQVPGVQIAGLHRYPGTAGFGYNSRIVYRGWIS
jgi:hypothetical protein